MHDTYIVGLVYSMQHAGTDTATRAVHDRMVQLRGLCCLLAVLARNILTLADAGGHC
jgi:hypothetical protein